jgi:hypothetical protein
MSGASDLLGSMLEKFIRRQAIPERMESAVVFSSSQSSEGFCPAKPCREVEGTSHFILSF